MRTHDPRHRIRHIALACLGVWVIFFGRLFYVQIICHPHYERQALIQHSRRVPLTGIRGTVYDRNGQVLAQDIRTSSVCAYPPQVRNKSATARKLSPILGIRYSELLRLLSKKAGYVSLARKISAEAEARLREAKLRDAELGERNLEGIDLIDDARRIYPLGRSACHVVGLVDGDGKGVEGIEAQLDSYLASTRGWFVLSQDAKGEELVTSQSLVKQPKPGANVVLTIDANYQAIAASCLKRAVQEHRAASGSIVMMDPENGEILAMVNEPSFDPGEPSTWRKGALRNRAVTDQFEPGSTFKLVTLAAVLEEGIADSTTMFYAENGTAYFGKHKVSDTSKHGWVSLKEFFELSSNIVAAKLGLMVGEEPFYKYCRLFGFGATTGIDLPGEASGKLRNTSEWSKRSLFTMAYGQEVSATSLQIAAAYAAVANDGVMMRPTIVRSVVGEDGRKLRQWTPKERRRVLSEKTCRTIKEFLAGVVETGTGRSAGIDWCRIGGKTGTAQKFNPATRSYSLYVSSFAGLVPVEDSKIVCLIVLDEPKEQYLAAVVAAPVFKEVIETVSTCSRTSLSPPFLKIPFESETDAALPVPNVRLLGEDEATQDLNRAGFRAKISGVGSRVIGQDPAPGTLATGGSHVRLELGDTEKLARVESVMPDLKGLSIREAVRRLSALAVRADVRGSGVVAAQSPPPGSKMRNGQCCVLECRPLTEMLGH